MKKYSLVKFLAIVIAAAVTMAFTVIEKGGKGSTSYKTNLIAGDSYRMFINNIDMPMGRNGIMGDVVINGALGGGKLDSKVFLFSGGFFMSGLKKASSDSVATLWSTGQMSASRITDYVPGTYATGQNDPNAQIYVINSRDPDFDIGVQNDKLKSWKQWGNAVALGADFYDGDKDGSYNPVDKNGNGKWDPDEDRPDLLGDETAWCVYSDQTSPALRTYSDVAPQGIEIRQTVFALNSKGITGNIIFVRYKITYTGKQTVSEGTIPDKLDSVYFGIAADPDIGDQGNNDLVGCDTTLNAGFTYHKLGAEDSKFGNTPPCFLIDFFQGPRSYIPGVTFTDNNNNGVYDDGIDTPIDTATDVRGRALGIAKYPGAKNLGLSSFVQYYNGIDPANRSQARFYNTGRNNVGSPIDPCTWTQGSVLGGVNCKDVNPNFMYSGDPTANNGAGQGWINITAKDQRMILNTGPFQLVKQDSANDNTVSIVVAYVVGRGKDALNSITVAKTIDATAQKIFDANFPSLPPPPALDITSQTGDGFIDLTWPTYKQIRYHAVDSVFQVDRAIHGFYVTQYQTNTKLATVNGQTNAIVIARYDMKDSIYNVFALASNGGVDLRMPQGPPENKMDSLVFADSTRGRIKLKITTDAFTGNPLIKGHQYYYGVTEFTINRVPIYNQNDGKYGRAGDYYDPTGGAVEEFDAPQLITAVMGIDEYAPSFAGQQAVKSNGPSSGTVNYLVVEHSQLTGDTYKVDFFKDSDPNEIYNPFWSLTNTKTGNVLIDSSREFNFDTTNYSGTVIEGFIPKIMPLTATIGTPVYQRNGVTAPDSVLFYPLFFKGGPNFTGIFYLGKNIPQGSAWGPLGGGVQENYIGADRLRRVEIRFGANGIGKAYRYLHGYLGSLLNQKNSNIYAAAITGNDTVGKGPVGNWDVTHNHANGFVDVPFTAWVIDSANNEQRQLAVGFMENKSVSNTPPKDFVGNPDGLWDPGTVHNSLEGIFIFDSDYDLTGNQVQYTGNSSAWADPVKGYNLNVTGATNEQIAIAKSPFFNTMYLVAFDKKPKLLYQPGDKFIIPVSTYPYTSKDEFQFKTLAKGILTTDAKKALFNMINVYPNPLYGYNPQTSYTNTGSPDAPFVTFSNLPEQVTVNIFTLSGSRVRTLTTADKSIPTSPFLQWNLQNESGLRVASGMYLAIVSCPGYGDKVLKFAIIMPQKQIKNY